MFDGRKGVVKMMQQGFPGLVLGRLAETHGVVFQRLPFHQQSVAVLVLQAML